jgi:hypothetical protein
MKGLAALLLAVPFLFGLLRFATTGADARYLAVAVASSLGAAIVLRTRATPSLTRFATGLGAAALCSAATGWAFGARSGPAIAVVSLAFAICSATGATLLGRTRMAAHHQRGTDG